MSIYDSTDDPIFTVDTPKSSVTPVNPTHYYCSKENVQCEYATSWGACSVTGCKNESVMGPKAAWWAGHYYGLW